MLVWCLRRAVGHSPWNVRVLLRRRKRKRWRSEPLWISQRSCIDLSASPRGRSNWIVEAPEHCRTTSLNPVQRAMSSELLGESYSTASCWLLFPIFVAMLFSDALFTPRGSIALETRPRRDRTYVVWKIGFLKFAVRASRKHNCTLINALPKKYWRCRLTVLSSLTLFHSNGAIWARRRQVCKACILKILKVS